MNNEMFVSLGRLSDNDLVRSLKALIGSEHDVTAQVQAPVVQSTVSRTSSI